MRLRLKSLEKGVKILLTERKEKKDKKDGKKGGKKDWATAARQSHLVIAIILRLHNLITMIIIIIITTIIIDALFLSGLHSSMLLLSI